MDADDYIAKLNTYIQRQHWKLHYEDAGTEGPDHIKTFNIKAVVNGKAYPEGVGKNKKEAKQKAAKHALQGLLKETESASDSSVGLVHSHDDHVSWLYSYGQKINVQITYIESTTGATFQCRYLVGRIAYPVATGRTMKEAKEEAAKLAYLKINASLTGDEKPSSTSSQQTEDIRKSISAIYDNTHNLKTKDDIVESDFIGQVLSICQRTNRINNFMEVERRGPPHDLRFVYKLVIDDQHYPACEGKSIKEAKQKAAQLALSDLRKGLDSETGDEKPSSTSSQQTEDMRKSMSEICDKTHSLKTEDDIVETNFIGRISAICQRTNRIPDFVEVERRGPPHDLRFVYKLVIDDQHYPPACEGKSVKEAKQKAAQLALSDLRMGLDSEVSPSRANNPPTNRDSSANAPSPNVQLKSPSTDIAIRFVDSSPKIQGKSPDCKPKVRIAANFPDKCQQKDAKSANVKGDHTSRFMKDFDVIEHLGNGGFGHVLKAKHKLEGKYYAVKVVSYKDNSRREVLALSEFQHDNVVRYYTCWLEDGAYQSFSAGDSSWSPPKKSLHIQMELCETKTLRMWINDKNVKNVERSQRRQDSLAIAKQIVSGVEYIHSKKFFHRDLKPANILFGPGEVLKIGDFGLVADDTSKERSGYLGTASYMAPEQKYKNIYDRKVDIFALGLIFFELLWKMITMSERERLWDDVRNKILPAEFAHHFPVEDQMIKAMLSLKPEDRPEASQLKTELEACARVLTLNATDRNTV
ncbi:interferon-induced, double-stranded RNA-activated protein kinase-like isoform X2 [Nerophis ophidion]|uniref:interferon-induced, double-stranded RNA-activated protein kinase-like isoform X2 n=1 Tax=Nerophis ophidion TaxID=159077 RepID=UPI002ADFD70D|nr:interferon-induced, double-stranded RNA-activated protein kinase-like isoform X2 [Nerophis ophidion]